MRRSKDIMYYLSIIISVYYFGGEVFDWNFVQQNPAYSQGTLVKHTEGPSDDGFSREAETTDSISGVNNTLYLLPT